MRKTALTVRPASRLILVLLTTMVAFVSAPAVASAAPVVRAPQPAPGDEGGSKNLRAVLEETAKAHIDAKVKLEGSQKHQAELVVELKEIEDRLVVLTAEVGVLAAKSYRVGRLSAVSMLLNSASPEAFLDRAAGLELLAQRDDENLHSLTEAREQATRAKAAIDIEVREQAKQLAIIAKKKHEAERALGGSASGGYLSANSPLARPAPRNADGSWPRESCTINDPTTSGCITPRTLHAMNEAKAAGFRRYVSCHRDGGGGEHPKGRACDFAAATDGFENRSATGGDRTYGNNLAAFLIKNANRLGVLYVIWYRQIWSPGTGWRSYSGAGSPAADHTNHVHLSMY